MGISDTGYTMGRQPKMDELHRNVEWDGQRSVLWTVSSVFADCHQSRDI